MCVLLLVCVAQSPELLPLYIAALIAKRLSIRGWPAGSPKDSEETVAFAKQMGIKCMVERFPLDKAQEAYDHRNTARFRSVIVPN